jgi:tRNA (cmo5U34)-methyltransferase
MNEVLEHFEREAGVFDGTIRRLIPHYHEMLDALVSALPFEADRPIRVTDLGCGTGTVAEGILAAFPNAAVTCIDISGNMLQLAEAKLAGNPRARFIRADFGLAEFDGGQDAFVSSLSLHHLATDGDKRSCYGRIFDSLAPGGVFVNADVVLAPDDSLQRTYMDRWKAFMRKSVPEDAIENEWIPRYRAEDRPAVLTDQLKWLETIGFGRVDVIWKYYNFAVYGGSRTDGRTP